MSRNSWPFSHHEKCYTGFRHFAGSVCLAHFSGSSSLWYDRCGQWSPGEWSNCTVITVGGSTTKIACCRFIWYMIYDIWYMVYVYVYMCMCICIYVYVFVYVYVYVYVYVCPFTIRGHTWGQSNQETGVKNSQGRGKFLTFCSQFRYVRVCVSRAWWTFGVVKGVQGTRAGSTLSWSGGMCWNWTLKKIEEYLLTTLT